MQQIINETIPLENLEGTWFIHMSDFPMWKKGDKTHPTFNYSIVGQREDAVLLDEVKYIKNGKEKSIVGFDRPTNRENTSFVWRGKGILSLLKSKWEIVHYDKKQEWMVIHFEKTLFTPEGYDVVSRKRRLSKEEVNTISKKLNELGIPKNLTLLTQN